MSYRIQNGVKVSGLVLPRLWADLEPSQLDGRANSFRTVGDARRAICDVDANEFLAAREGRNGRALLLDDGVTCLRIVRD